MDKVFVVYGDVAQIPGFSTSADDRRILAVTSSIEKAREIVRELEELERDFDNNKVYAYVDFDAMSIEK